VSTTSGLIAKVVKRGLVSKRAADRDRRRMRLELTEEGRRLTDEVAVAGHGLLERAAALLGPDLERATESLGLVADAASQAREEHTA